MSARWWWIRSVFLRATRGTLASILAIRQATKLKNLLIPMKSCTSLTTTTSRCCHNCILLKFVDTGFFTTSTWIEALESSVMVFNQTCSSTLISERWIIVSVSRTCKLVIWWSIFLNFFEYLPSDKFRCASWVSEFAKNIFRVLPYSSTFAGECVEWVEGHQLEDQLKPLGFSFGSAANDQIRPRARSREPPSPELML